ncbi:MAG: glycerol-3-phosphate 1-O-acyltransferase PlsY [bacterium]
MTFSPALLLVFQAGLAYLLGSFPSAYLAGRWTRGLDLRKHGSGNLGATNVFRVLGPGPGVAVLLVDVSKGALAVLLLPHLGQAAGSGLAPLPAWWPCVLGLAAVLGHSYTVFLGFKGGKGVATSLGVFLGLAPLATLCVLAVFGVVFGLTRMVSAGSLMASLVLPPALLVLGETAPRSSVVTPGGSWAESRPVLCLGLALAVLIWLRHIPNLRRILKGTENRVGTKKAVQP